MNGWLRVAVRQFPLLLVTVAILLPLYFMVANSLKSNDAFLASPMSRWVTGQTIIVDGGQLLFS